MSEADRKKWNERYARGDHASARPSPVLERLEPHLPAAGRALELAGGAGRHALWLSHRGWEVTLADISETGLALAAERARQARLSLSTLRIDLETEPFPPGPWDLILCVQYLHRPLFKEIPRQLAHGGMLVVIHPTERNLERHTKPPRRFLLRDGELRSLVPDLQILHYEEGWSADNRHDAVLVALRNR